MFKRKIPKAYTVFNYNPESFLWSVQHRLPMKEDCAAVGKPGKMLVCQKPGLYSINSSFCHFSNNNRVMRRYAMKIPAKCRAAKAKPQLMWNFNPDVRCKFTFATSLIIIVLSFNKLICCELNDLHSVNYPGLYKKRELFKMLLHLLLNLCTIHSGFRHAAKVRSHGVYIRLDKLITVVCWASFCRKLRQPETTVCGCSTML